MGSKSELIGVALILAMLLTILINCIFVIIVENLLSKVTIVVAIATSNPFLMVMFTLGMLQMLTTDQNDVY